MSGKTDNGTRWAVQVIVEFDAGLFRHFRVAAWNQFVGDLVRRGLTPVAWAKGERPPPVAMEFEFRGLRAAHRRLDGINLTFCDLAHADLEGSSLKGAKIGDCPRANLRDTKLQGAEFLGDVRRADFTGAAIQGTSFLQAYHYEGEPPLGLPPDALAAIRSVPREMGDGDEPFMPPVRARISVHEVPW